MKRGLLGFLLVSHVALATAAGEATGDPWMVLQKAAQAARELSYQGVFVYQSGTGSRSVQITHMNYGQGEYARIVVLDGTPREVLSQGRDVVIFSPRNEKVVIEKRRGQNMFPAVLPSNLDAIKTSYDVKFGGLERIGGRDGQMVILSPKDKFRYTYKFWADREYGLLLKSMSTNERNEPMEQFAFNQLTLMNSQKMDWFQPNVSPEKQYVMEESGTGRSEPVSTITWSVDQLPSGYRKVDEITRLVPGKPGPVTQIVYSDGLASVSLFIEPLLKGAAPKVGHSAFGATHFYANVLEGHQVVVVGEVPEATVTQIANTIHFKK